MQKSNKKDQVLPNAPLANRPTHFFNSSDFIYLSHSLTLNRSIVKLAVVLCETTEGAAFSLAFI